ncbi:MAG TPA: GNAT family N-acetyltransferase [Microvirga sp.]
MTAARTIRPATPDDIPFIMGTERLPGYEWVVGRWTEEQHRAALADPAQACFVGEAAGRPFGFAILQHLDDPWGNVLLKRIAVREPGGGFGRSLMEAVSAWTFAQPRSHRLWLTVAPRNERGHKLYANVGFVEEGRMRQSHVAPDGRRFSPIVMSLLRPDYEVRGASGVRTQ